jgi:hypothetical protein
MLENQETHFSPVNGILGAEFNVPDTVHKINLSTSYMPVASSSMLTLISNSKAYCSSGVARWERDATDTAVGLVSLHKFVGEPIMWCGQ